jgi:tRNA (cmo5U34)-methyltransferase
LDTGCGTGQFLDLAHDVFPQCRFFAADPSAAMLECAKKRLHDYPEITFLPPSTTEALPEGLLPQLQVITAIQCHHYLQPDGRRLATQRCYDLLQTGGILVSFENSHPETDAGTQLGLKRWGRFQKAHGHDSEAVNQHAQRFGTNYFPIGLDEQRINLTAAGFKTVELFWHSYMQTGWYAIK